MAQKTPRVFVSLINEVFGTNYSGEAKLEQLRNEFYKEDGVVITDSIFKIGGERYHIECQSNQDGTMAIRMVEYDFLSGLMEARKQNEYEKVELPMSCVLYLRSTRNTPDSLTIKICQGDRSMDYATKVIKLSDYTADVILEKKLLIMIPFLMFNYEKKLKSKMNRDEALEDVVKECQKIAYLLNNLGEEEVTNNELTDLIEGFEKVTGYLFKNDPRVSEEVEKVMGGNVYKTRSEILLEEGMERGMEKGREEGREEINALTAFLIDNNRLDDLKRATKDSEYQEKLLEEMRQIK
ncbi:MAG: hypothetical protein IKZ94_08900 [Lachnospiraceae bacterium]|nr:hypothetical protein [Lachnospiraceae bacterium]